MQTSVQHILENTGSVSISENLNLSRRPPFHNDLGSNVNISWKYLDTSNGDKYAYITSVFAVSTVHKLGGEEPAGWLELAAQQGAAVSTIHDSEALVQVLGSHHWSSFQNLAREACVQMKLLLELHISIIRRIPMDKDRTPSPWTSRGHVTVGVRCLQGQTKCSVWISGSETSG